MNNYNLEALGATRYQLLVNAILKFTWREKLETFKEGKDDGADGIIKITENEKYLVQSKYKTLAHMKDTDSLFQQLKTTFKQELEKSEILKDETKEYHFHTNADLSKNQKDELNSIFTEKYPSKILRTQSRTDLYDFLNSNPTIAQSFPEILNISHLRTIINESNVSSSKFYFEEVAHNAKTYAPTQVYAEALRILENHHFVILTGSPKAGKTSTAEALAFSYVQTGYSIFEIHNAETFFEVLNISEKVVIVCDDVFGDVVFKESKGEDWHSHFRKILRSLGPNKKLIWTSRNYIFEELLSETKFGEEQETIKKEKIEVNVGNLSSIEKAYIVKNHFKASSLNPDQKKILVSLAPRIVKSSYFNPESIRQLASNKFVEILGSCSQNQYEIFSRIEDFLKEPTQGWILAFNKLSEDEKIILKVLARNDAELTENKLSADTTLPIENIKAAISKLSGSFIKTKFLPNNESRITFFHPSLKDMMVKIMNENPNDRISVINSLSFKDTVKSIFKQKSTYRIPSYDNSTAHKFKFNNQDDKKFLLARLESFTKNIGLSDFIFFMTEVEDSDESIHYKENLLSQCLGHDFFERNKNFHTFLWVIFLRIWVADYKSGKTNSFPSFLDKFATENSFRSPWNKEYYSLLELLKQISPLIADRLLEETSKDEAEHEFEDIALSHLGEFPKYDRYDEGYLDSISSWISDAEEFLDTVSSYESTFGDISDKHYIEELENKIREAHEEHDEASMRYNEYLDYAYDQHKEERNFYESQEDSAIRKIFDDE